MEAADTVIVLADSSKFEYSTLLMVAKLSEVSVLVTDEQISDKARSEVAETASSSWSCPPGRGPEKPRTAERRMTKLPVTNLPVTNMAVDILLDAHAGTAEGPVWTSDASSSSGLTSPGRASTSPTCPVVRRLRRRRDPGGCVVPRHNGGFAMGACQEFLLCGPGRPVHSRGARAHHRREPVRVNDGKCDPPAGSSPGTAANDGRWGTGALYRLGADHSLELVLAGVTCANGLGWSLDSRTFYYVDTPTYRNSTPSTSTPSADRFPTGGVRPH